MRGKSVLPGPTARANCSEERCRSAEILSYADKNERIELKQARPSSTYIIREQPDHSHLGRPLPIVHSGKAMIQVEENYYSGRTSVAIKREVVIAPAGGFESLAVPAGPSESIPSKWPTLTPSPVAMRIPRSM